MEGQVEAGVGQQATRGQGRRRGEAPVGRRGRSGSTTATRVICDVAGCGLEYSSSYIQTHRRRAHLDVGPTQPNQGVSLQPEIAASPEDQDSSRIRVLGD